MTKVGGEGGENMKSQTLQSPFLPVRAMLFHLHNEVETELVHRLLFHFIAMQLHPALIVNLIYGLSRRRPTLGDNYSWLILA